MDKKRKAQADIMVSMFMIIFLLIVAAYMLQITIFRTTKATVEDALAASNLASAVVDIQEYGVSHNLVIGNPEAAFQLYQDALKSNLKLNSEWECENKASIAGKVEIVEYTVYNVRGPDVEIVRFDGSGYLGSEELPGGFGSVRAPTGAVIESTSVYSRIRFPVHGILGVEAVADKEKLADIVKGI